jgi:hypothetical protein
MTHQVGAQFILGIAFQLPDPLPTEIQRFTDLLKRQLFAAQDAKSIADDVSFSIVQVHKGSLYQSLQLFEIEAVLLTQRLAIGKQAGKTGAFVLPYEIIYRFLSLK